MWRFARGGTAGIWVGAMVAFPQVPDLPAILPPAEIVAPPTTAPAAAPVAPRPVAAPPSQNAELVAP